VTFHNEKGFPDTAIGWFETGKSFRPSFNRPENSMIIDGPLGSFAVLAEPLVQRVLDNYASDAILCFNKKN
jgi:hypothetical protein